MSTKLTREQFIANGKRAAVRAILVILVFVGVMVAIMLGGGAYLSGHGTASSAVLITAVALLFIVPVVVFVGSLLAIHRAYGLACPQCSRTFLGVTQQVVIATGHCGSCGAQVLKDS